MQTIKLIFFGYILSYAVYAHQVSNKLFTTSELYPMSSPYNEGYLQVSSIHKIYFAEFGNPKGLPVLCVHGGPGAGCSTSWIAFFDPAFYRIIMFDQRGANHSEPFAEMYENTPHYSVTDIEQLRKHLNIDKWLLFGGSWGSALSILYGETHPDRVLGFILRGIFLARKKDYEHLFYGMRSTFPEAWDDMIQIIPEKERSDLITSFHKRVIDADPKVHLPAAHSFMRFDIICGTLLPNDQLVNDIDTNDKQAIAIARAYIHYSANQFWLEDNQLLKNITKISHLPAIIVQGRYDVICPASTAYELHTSWQNSQLWYIPNAGHFSTESSIAQGSKNALDEMKKILS